jgi:hypothetical protein
MQEMESLHRLHSKSSHPCIPTSPNVELGIAGFRRLCEKSEVPRLAVSGSVGIAASDVVFFSTVQLTKIFKDVLSAFGTCARRRRLPS